MVSITTEPVRIFLFMVLLQHRKSSLHYTRGIMAKRVTSDGAHLHGVAPEQTQLRRNVAAVVRRRRLCVQLNRLRN